MAQKTLVRDISLVDDSVGFYPFRPFGEKKESYDFESLSLLRHLLSKEKARLVHIIKSKHPKSLYQLAKLLGRDFKAVVLDIKLLERFGMIEMVSEKTGKRERFRPILKADSLQINLKF